MKKFVRVLASLSMIILITSSVNSFAKKQPKKTTANNTSGITYVVTISHLNSGLCGSYQVVIKDEAGNIIGSPKAYQEGIDNYIFHENGPVLGTRIAQLERIVGSGQYLCNKLVRINPDQITGKFRNGATYLFSLTPVVRPGHD